VLIDAARGLRAAPARAGAGARRSAGGFSRRLLPGSRSAGEARVPGRFARVAGGDRGAPLGLARAPGARPRGRQPRSRRLRRAVASALPGPERTRGIVVRGDARIEVIAEGAGPLVVLLPSRGRESEDYDEVAAGIARAGFRVLRPQPRGTGASSGPMTGLTLHDFAGDVAAVIAHAGGGPAVVAGHAFGNWVARMTATDHPQLVRGVIILAAAAKTYPEA